jgi:hypothetical protein
VDVARFGAFSGVGDVGPAFARAIAELTRSGGGRLLVPPGVYTFAAEAGPILWFAGLADVDIEAYGAAFVFRGLARPFRFENCRNVRLRGVTIDWARAPFSQGEIEAQAPDRKSADVVLDEATPMDGWTTVKAIGGYDRETGLMTRSRLDVYGVGDAVEPLGPRRVRVHFRWPVDLSQARTLLLRHAVYEAHAINAQGCTDVAIEDVTVVVVPGIGFVGGRCRNLSLTRCVVAPRPGSGLFMSTCAGASHFTNCSGEVTVEGCRFSRMGDDGVNVNAAYRKVIGRPDARTLIVANRNDFPFRPEEAPPPGDRFEIASAATLETRGEDALARASLEPGAPATRERLVFAQDLPAQAAAGDVVVDKSQLPRLTVRDCLFEGNRARGVLAHAHARIENCQFRDQTLEGVLLSPNLFWMEGPEVADVRVVGNLFDGVDRWGTRQGAIRVDAQVEGPKGKTVTSPGRPNHDVTIENNVFRNIDGPNVILRAMR